MNKVTESNDVFFAEYHDSIYIKSHDNRKSVVVEENKRKYILTNDLQKELIVYHIDGGVINNAEANKCDFGIYCEDKYLILIELKGSDYEHACEQIASTIKLMKISNLVDRIYARIVLSKMRTPALRSTQETTLKKLLSLYVGFGS